MLRPYIPVEHDPLRDGDYAILRLVERGQLGLDRVVRVRHCAESRDAARRGIVDVPAGC